MTRWLIGAVAALALAAGLTRGGEARADADRIQLWFEVVGEGDPLFIGTMASEEMCERTAAALARDRHQRGQGRFVAVFECRPLELVSQ